MTVEARPGTGTARAAAPPRLKHAIYWRETEPVEPGPRLERDVRCDVCIVGAGYTGLWTAYFLKQAEPSLSIHLLEQEYAGAAASGHNDGFVTPTIGHNSLAGLVRRFGHEPAKAGFGAVGRSILELGRFCRKEGVDADFEANGNYLVATSPGQVERLQRNVELAAELGAHLEVLDRDAARAKIGSPAIELAVGQGGALVNPHKLARGLARVVREKGVEIHEGTPATRLERDGAGWRVVTPRGRVQAADLVLATNAFQHQFAEFRRQVKPVWSYAMVSEPVPDRWLEELPWPGREGFVEMRNFVLFARLTAENRILIGGGPAPYFYGRDMNDSHMRHEGSQEALRAAFERYFPGWHGLRFTHAYGGCVAVTRDLVPHIGRLGSGAYYGYGYCGNGIAATHAAGKALRDLILGRDTDYSNLPFVRGREPRFPPEPLAYAGSKLLSRVLAWQDEHPERLRRELV